MTKLFSLILFGFLCAGCTPDETLPPERASTGITMDGSHFIPISGPPDEISQTKQINASATGETWSTAPVALHDPLAFAIGTSAGRIYLYKNDDSLANVISVGSAKPIEQLLVDTSSIYAIMSGGAISSYSFDGKQRWTANVGIPTSAALLSFGEILIPLATGVKAVSTSTGAQLWSFPSGDAVSSLALATDRKLIAAAVTHGSSQISDSVVFLTPSGNAVARFALDGRLTSNIAICGENHDVLAAGMLMQTDAVQKPTCVRQFGISDPAKVIIRSVHVLPYLVLSVGANNRNVYTNGMRTIGGERVSGADAFAMTDTSVVWSRRFTEPLVSPVAVSDGNLYFTMTFHTEAIVASKGLFITLDAASGKTISQRALKGVMDGFVPGMPMPDERGRLLVADKAKLIVHILDRSTLKRFF